MSFFNKAVSKITVDNLFQLCKDNEIVVTKNMKKDQLKKLLHTKFIDDCNDLKKQTLASLEKFCKENKIKGYSVCKKDDLVELIVTYKLLHDDDVVGDEMRHMAGDGEHQIMMGCIHDLNLGAKPAPESFQCGNLLRITAFWRREDAPAIVEQLGKSRFWPGLFGASNRMAGNEMHALRYMGPAIAQNGTLD